MANRIAKFWLTLVSLAAVVGGVYVIISVLSDPCGRVAFAAVAALVFTGWAIEAVDR